MAVGCLDLLIVRPIQECVDALFIVVGKVLHQADWKKIPKISKILGIFCGTPEGTRTPDLLIRRAVQTVFHRIIMIKNR